MLRNIHKKNFIFAGVVLLITSMIIIFITLKGKSTQDLETIDLNKFEQLITTATSDVQYIYVGRESCSDCTTVYPRICAISHRENLPIFYYNTESDRESQPEKMHILFNHLKVDSVPMIIKLQNGNVVERYDGEEFIKMFEKEGTKNVQRNRI